VLELDLRAVERAALVEAEAAVRSITERSHVAGTTAELVEVARHWPMEKLERSDRLVQHAQAIAAALGYALNDAATGGASDGNTTAGMGVATLDGLGPIGGNDHSPAEYLEVDSIVPRTTLLAALLLVIGRDPVIAAWRQA
jgi:glutamate carboxypeptidase